ncbi:MAG: InlB B-repeat-containing protein, partial [Clostridia bacterium]
MLNRNKLLLPIAIIICLLAVTLFACATPPKVTDIEIGGDYITLYNLGEELDLSGMKIKVKYSDSTTAEYAVQDIRQDITVLGFNNAREENALKITITYQGQSAQFTVRVLSTINSSIKYSVKFDTGEGSAIDDVEVFAYTTVNAPVIDPQRDGWYFVGWYKEDSLTNPWDFNTEKIVEETTLYAKWGKLLTVTFAPPQGLEHLFAPIVKNDVREGETYNNRPPVPVRDGYTARWDYNGEWNDLVDTQTIHAEYTLIQYRVVFYFMNESDNEESVELGGGNMTFTYGENVLENQDAADFLRTMPRPSRRNYHISGWKLKDAAGDESESYDAFITHIQSDVHIMAVYHIDMYTVTFNFGEGEDIEENIVQTDVAYGTSVPQSQRPEPPARQHYEFDGWYADQSLSILWNFNTGKIDAARTLYARWTRIYTLVFHGYDGDGDNGGNTITLKVREGDNVVPPAAKAPEGHTAQWDRDSFENIRQDDLEINPLPPVPNQYTIRFVNFDNTPLLVNGAESQLVSYGQSAIAPDEEPQRERYNFLGWSADFSVVIDNMIIAAEFAPIRYTVEFLSDGGDKPAVVVNSGDKLLASMLEITPRNNFDFDGWFKDVTRLLPWNVEEDTVEGNITLYAKWTQLHIARFQYTSAQDETTTITVERRVREGETIKDAPVMDKLPGKNGSWYINGSLVDLSTYYVFNAIDIVAQYAPAVYTVTFRSDGVDYEVRAQVRYNEIISAPAVNPEREGHNFIGWNIDPALTPIVEDTYFDAMFAPKTFKVRFIDAFNENEPVILLHHGEDPGHPEISYGGIAPAPRQNPSHLGWRFIGWGTAAASGVVDGINSNITGHTDIYAQYSKNQYSVTFFSEHDNHIWAVFSVEHGEVSPVPEGVNPSRTGHIFEGWNYQSAPIVENTYINAVFVMARYVVTIHLNGGSGTPQEVSGLYNTFLPEPPKPVFEGKAFLGWYTDAEFTKRYVFENGQSIERLTASFSIYARWEDYVYGDNDIEYSLDVNGTGYIVVSVPDGKEEREIANYYAKDGGLMLPVTAIGYNAFANLTQLKRVTLPQTLSFIGPAAFINCTALEEIVIPDTVATISQNAFSGCTSLVSVGFGEHSMLVEIGSFAFNNASSLFEIEFPSTLEKIGERAFSGASSLETIVIPESINDIGAYAFAGCVNLKYAKFVETAPPRIATTTFAGHSSFFRVYVANLQQYNSGTGGWVTLREQGKIFPINDEYEQAGITQDWAYQVILTGDSAGKLSILQYIGGQSEVVLENTLEVNGVMREVIEVGAYAFDNTVHTLRLNSDFLLDVNTLTAATELK